MSSLELYFNETNLSQGSNLATESQAGFQPSSAPQSCIHQTGVTSALHSLGNEHFVLI